jgi:hypothetical protein
MGMSASFACRMVLTASITGLVLFVAGCNSSTPAVPSEEQVRDVLSSVLDTWKAGGRAEDLRGRSPEIVAGDWQWSQGHRLVDYRLTEPATLAGGNMRVPATLNVQFARGGNPKKMDVTYVVILEPVITVIREFE